MTKKREMAEWIFDFFRSANSDTGHIVMMRNVQNKLIELNPRERDLFVPVANELIANGYFTYEEGALQSLRLTQKGRDYIYTPGVELDCCFDNKYTPVQQRYISNWHNNFVSDVNRFLTIIDSLLVLPNVSNEDKYGLGELKALLSGSDVSDIQVDLADGNVKQSTLDKIEKLNKDIVDICFKNIQMSPLVKEFWRQMARINIERNKNNENDRLASLKIPVLEG